MKQILFFLLSFVAFTVAVSFCLYSTWQKVQHALPLLFICLCVYLFIDLLPTITLCSMAAPTIGPHSPLAIFALKSDPLQSHVAGAERSLHIFIVMFTYMCKFMVRSWLPDALTVCHGKKETSELKHVATSCSSKLLFLSAPPSISSNLRTQT